MGILEGGAMGWGRERMSGTFGFMRRADNCRYIRSPSRKPWYSAFISITLTSYWMKRTMVTISVDMDRSRDQIQRHQGRSGEDGHIHFSFSVAAKEKEKTLTKSKEHSLPTFL